MSMTGLSLKEECEMRRLREEDDSKGRDRRRRSNSRERRRSGSRERRRSGSRDRRRSRSRSQDGSFSRGRGGGRRNRARQSSVDKRARVYSTKDPNTINCRVFVGNFPSNSASEKDTRELFDKFGNILALSLHCNFAFIQYEKEEEARAAVRALAQSRFKGATIDVKMAAEGRKKSSRSPSRERIRSMERERRSPERPLMRDHGRDPYMERRDPYADPYGPPRPTRPADRPPFEVQIFMHSPQQRGYAEAIDARLRRMDMMTDILVVIEQELSKLLMDTTRRGVPYAIVLTPQNEMHRSLTLNILYGTPQEHRNMPLEDAMSLVSRNFQIFLRERQERLAKVTAAPPAPPPVAHVAHVAHVTPPVPPTGAPPEFVLPDKHTRYLLNLIADDRILSVEEIDKLLDYLEDRRFRYIQVHGGPTRISKRYPLNQQPTGSAANSTASVAEKVIDQQQQQLQDRILSILNGGDVSSAVASVVNTVKQPEPLPSTPSMGINFDNPSVQKALNDLLQTGPLLTNLGASSMASTMPSTSQAYQQSISSQGYHQTANVHPQYVSRNQFNPY